MNIFKFFFGVVGKKQTYLNGLYLLITFPLGLAYGIFLAVGWFLGYGLVLGGLQAFSVVSDLFSYVKILAIVLGGLFVWLLFICTFWIPAHFERSLAVWLLGVKILPAARRFPPPGNFWSRIGTYLRDPLTWKSVIFIALKFPLGIVLFTVVIGLLSAAGGLFFAPLAHLIGFKSFIIGPWRIDTWIETFIACVMGIFALPLSLHLLNGLAMTAGWFARIMLTDRHKGNRVE